MKTARLPGTGCLSILPVDQGVEDTATLAGVRSVRRSSATERLTRGQRDRMASRFQKNARGLSRSPSKSALSEWKGISETARPTSPKTCELVLGDTVLKAKTKNRHWGVSRIRGFTRVVQIGAAERGKR